MFLEDLALEKISCSIHRVFEYYKLHNQGLEGAGSISNDAGVPDNGVSLGVRSELHLL